MDGSMLLQFFDAASARRSRAAVFRVTSGTWGEQFAVEMLDGLRAEQAAVIHFGEQHLRAPAERIGIAPLVHHQPVNAPSGSKPASSAYRQKMI